MRDKKTKIPADRAKAYEELLGKQRGDNVVIKNKAIDKNGLPKPLHNLLTSIFGIAKIAIAVMTIVFIVVYSVSNVKDMFGTIRSFEYTWFESISLFFIFLCSEVKIVIPALIGCAVLLAIVFFLEFVYYLCLYLIIAAKDAKMEKSNEDIINVIKDTLSDDQKPNDTEQKSEVEFADNVNEKA